MASDSLRTLNLFRFFANRLLRLINTGGEILLLSGSG